MEFERDIYRLARELYPVISHKTFLPEIMQIDSKPHIDMTQSY